MSADAAKLMDTGIAAKYGPIINMDVTCKLRVVGEGRAISNLTIVRNMHIRHDPVVVAQAGNAYILRSSQIEGTEFANCVSIPYLKARRLAGVFLVLWYFANGTELKNTVVAPDPGMSGNDDMRTDS
jgi:hypothetical protein